MAVNENVQFFILAQVFKYRQDYISFFFLSFWQTVLLCSLHFICVHSSDLVFQTSFLLKPLKCVSFFLPSLAHLNVDYFHILLLQVLKGSFYAVQFFHKSFHLNHLHTDSYT